MISPQEDWIDLDGVKGLVSIVIPTCNRSSLLLETLDSIYAQDYRPLQVVVVDDDSADDTEKTVAGVLARNDPGIDLQYFRQEKAGAPVARNFGAKKTTGEFIVFMDDDDIFSPRFVASHVETLQTYPNADLSYSRWQRFRRSDTHYQMLNKKGVFPATAESPWEAFLIGWTLLLQSCMIRRYLVRATGPWREDLWKSQDLDYKARLLALSNVVVEAPEAAVFYRVHKASVSGQLNAAKLDSYCKVLDDVEQIAVKRDDYQRIRPALADFLWQHSYWLNSNGELASARRTLAQAKQHDATVGRRNGPIMSRAMSYLGMDAVSGTLLYGLFRSRVRLFGMPPVDVKEYLEQLPQSLTSDSA